MSKPISGRRIKVDVILSGGRVKLDLTDPTDAQLARITRLLEEWLDEEKHPWQPPEAAAPADSSRTEPIRHESLPPEQSTLLAKVTQQVDKPVKVALPEPAPKRVSCGVLDGLTGHRCRRPAGHEDEKHAWWGRGSASHNWTDRAPEPAPEPERPPWTPSGPEAETVEDVQAGHAQPDPTPLDAAKDRLAQAQEAYRDARIDTAAERNPTPAGVVLCRCGHGERMHERDELVGRGQCHHAACGCSEFRAAA